MPKGKKADVQFVLPEKEPEPEVVEIDEGLEVPYTSILMSMASGDGLYTAMAKTKASFEIVAYDQHGERRPTGNDPFAVSVRGAAFVFAKVIDNDDGSYKVEYKPSTSGTYSIAITLHGVPMPGSPFALTVLAPRADASRCMLRGEALRSIVARAPQTFDVEFVDAFGSVAHAEELDVYVEPRPVPTLPDGAPPLPTEGIIWAVVAPNLPKPLVVRATEDLASDHVGEIGPGAMVGVLETKDLNDGSRRARVMFKPLSGRIGGVNPLRSPPNSPDRVRPGSPAMTARTGSPGRQTPMSTARSARTPNSARTPSSARSSQNSARSNSPGRSPRWSFTPNAWRNETPRSPGRSPRSSFTNPLGSSRGTPRVPSFARPIGELASADRPRSRSPTSVGLASNPDKPGLVGWVTAAKDGKETLVLRHLKLDASRRQMQMQLWSKQQAAEANRKAGEHRTHKTQEEQRAARAGPSCAHELASDKRGIAFAYGGVEPGTLHAHGKLVKAHQVQYSVGRAGEYLLHVGIRNQTAALPGSPFELKVEPGVAHPVATSLAVDEFGASIPLRGVVGDAGSVVIATSDRMGNRCVVGGAPLRVETKSKDLRTSQIDQGDGTYALQWLGEVSGKYEINVTIDNVNVTGSPCALMLLSATPEVAKCEVSGDGLNDAVAGEKVQVMVRCKDRFSNPTTPGTAMSFGLAVAPPGEMAMREKEAKKKDKEKDKDGDGEKEKKKDKDKDKEEDGASALPSQPFDGKWLAEGEYEIKYSAEKAGEYELHLWCDVEGNGVRQKLPGSPFPLRVVAARPTAGGSLVTGAPTQLTAGDALELGIHFRDDFANPCAPPDAKSGAAEEEGAHDDGAKRGSPGGKGRGRPSHEEMAPSSPVKLGKKEEGVVAKLITPHEEEIVTEKMRRGDAVGSFGLRYELQVAGAYEVHFTLNGMHLKGSPVLFKVKPDKPSGRLSTLHQPVDTPPVVGVLYEMLLIAEDKYGNKLDRGGASIQARVGGPSASAAQHDDHNDGTYGVRFTISAPGEYRIEVKLDNNKIKASPMVINFTEPNAAQRKQLAAMGATPGAGLAAAAKSGGFDDADGSDKGSQSPGASPAFQRGDEPTESSQDPESAREDSVRGGRVSFG